MEDGERGPTVLVEQLVRRRRVDDVQDQIRDQRLLECRGEAFHELGRQATDETDRVRDQIPAALVLERARGRIERFEQAVVDRHLGFGECVQQSRLADVRVAGEGDGRRFRPLPLLSPHLALLAEVGEPAAQERDATARDPAVALELGLTRAASPDACPE